MRMMALPILAVALLALPACGSEPSGHSSDTPPVSAAPPIGETSIAGLYEVSGLTTELDSGDQREIAGTVILSQQGDHYTATFNLRTMFPTPSGALPAEVIGMGEGDVNGGTLSGIAETQVVMSMVPGVDSAFAFVPRRVSQRIVSSTLTEISPDGRVQIEIQSEPAPGDEYVSTKTTLAGELVSAPRRVPPLR